MLIPVFSNTTSHTYFNTLNNIITQDGKKHNQSSFAESQAKLQNLDNNVQQIDKPLGDKDERLDENVQPIQKEEDQNMALQPPDVKDQVEDQKPVQALEAPDANVGNPNSQERQNAAFQAVGAAPVVGDSKEGAAIMNNVDNNGNGADVADLPVHRGVKEDPANAIENP